MELQSKKIQTQLSKLYVAKSKHPKGKVLSYDAQRTLRLITEFEAQLEELSRLEVASVDVTQLLQRRIDEVGDGICLTLFGRSPSREDGANQRMGDRGDPEELNTLFGSDPLPNQTKELVIDVAILGHDHAGLTASEELTLSGNERNFISRKTVQKVVRVEPSKEDNRSGVAYLEEDFIFTAKNVLPVIEIARASYGHPTDLSKAYDVSAKIRDIVQRLGGGTFRLGTQASLDAMFSDPCRGVRKHLLIKYVTRGYVGTIRIMTNKLDQLPADLCVGYLIPPTPNHDMQLLSRHYTKSIKIGDMVRVHERNRKEPVPERHADDTHRKQEKESSDGQRKEKGNSTKYKARRGRRRARLLPVSEGLTKSQAALPSNKEPVPCVTQLPMI